MDKKFAEAIAALPRPLQDRLSAFPPELSQAATEISIRVDKPLVVNCTSGCYFMKSGGGFTSLLPQSPYIASPQDLRECVCTLTQYSIHSCKADINSGFITIKGGHRAGLAGTAVYENKTIYSINDFSSINLRIARQKIGAAADLTQRLFKNGLCSVLIVGAPSTGKTTLLRDICRCLTLSPYMQKLSIIDERGELAAIYRGSPQNDVGVMSDVFNGYRKRDGMEIAVRAMSPKAIVLDEIGGQEDIEAVSQSIHAGCAVIATIHAGSESELLLKTQLKPILPSFSQLVFLKTAATPGEVEKIISVKELLKCSS